MAYRAPAPGRHRRGAPAAATSTGGRLGRLTLRTVIVVSVALGMSGFGLLAGGDAEQRLADPTRRPAATAPSPEPTAPDPAVVLAGLRTELRLVRQRRTTVATALVRAESLAGQLKISGLPSDPGVTALGKQLRHRDSTLAATERRLRRRIAALSASPRPLPIKNPSTPIR